eukprot:SAG31_NODE_20292_length_578_cov_1.077244_1_plen_47_part_01
MDRDCGRAATLREEWKRDRYERTMQARRLACVDGGMRCDRFVPLGFE